VALALEVLDTVDASGAVEARVSETIVNVVLAQGPVEAGVGAVAFERVHQVHTSSTVATRARLDHKIDTI
jgi:hypothetical protein